MNKTLNINLAGIVFHIDEDAFEILNNYLNALKNHFKNEEGADEILKDIEGRIAELFTERLDKKEAISITDVKEVTAIMGNPSQYDDEIEENQTHEKQNKEEDLRAGKRNRIFRDADDRMVAGVCGGLANYFNIDPLWFRIIFLIVLFTGGGFLIYIIFWIAIPEAKTTAEKLEMRGEKVNITNIEKNIKDELGNLKEKMDEFASQPKTIEYGKKARTITQNITDFFISLFSGVVKFIGSCLGMLAVGIGVMFFIIVYIILFSKEGLHFDFYHSPYLNLSSIDNTLSYGLLLFFGVPIVAVILTGLRLLFKTKIHSNYKKGMLLLWVISWILIGSNFVNNKYGTMHFNVSHQFENINIEQDTVFIYSQEKERVKPFKRTKRGYKIVSDSIPFENTNITLDIQRSKSSDFILSKNSSGYNFQKKKDKNKKWLKPLISIKVDTIQESEITKDKKNLSLEESINYNYQITKDDLVLDDFFTLEKESKWIVEEVNLLLKVPTGKTIYLDHSLNNIIDDIEDGMWDEDMLGHYWKMEKNGLTCLSCQ
jgi:phage shock protein PspC (stress-responsive transcriptional regulator)